MQKVVDWQDKSLQPIPKAELQRRKVMLCVWWDHQGIIHFEFLNYNQMLNADLYSQQLQHMHGNLRKCTTFVNRRNLVLLYHDSATFSKNHAEKNIGFRPDPTPHPPDFTLSDFHIFHSLQNVLTDKKFSQKDQVKMLMKNLSLKPAEFYLGGINKLHDKWQELILNKGKYAIHWN